MFFVSYLCICLMQELLPQLTRLLHHFRDLRFWKGPSLMFNHDETPWARVSAGVNWHCFIQASGAVQIYTPVDNRMQYVQSPPRLCSLEAATLGQCYDKVSSYSATCWPFHNAPVICTDAATLSLAPAPKEIQSNICKQTVQPSPFLVLKGSQLVLCLECSYCSSTVWKYACLNVLWDNSETSRMRRTLTYRIKLCYERKSSFPQSWIPPGQLLCSANWNGRWSL